MTNLKIAIQKSGRLFEDSQRLLKECGIYINNGKDQLIAQASNFPAEVLYLRNSDIPQYLKDGVVDVAIIGENTLIEKKAENMKILPLGFSKCRVSIAIPHRESFGGITSLQNKKIATSYPHTVQTFLNEHKLNAQIHEISGSVEISPNIGLADIICDIVSTGSTLFKNGLKEVYKIADSQAVLASAPNLSSEKQQILDKLIFRITSVLTAKNTKYILLNAHQSNLENICKLLPGLKSPTIIPLKEEGLFSVHSVIEEDDFWNIIDSLKEAGAESILVIPIEKMIL